MIDAHVHLDKGPLNKEYFYKFVKEAQNKGIDELHILNHTHRFKEFKQMYDKYRCVPEQNEWFERDLQDSIYDYINLIEELKKEELPIKVKYGLEVCYQKEDEEVIKKLLKVYDWDFLIGSVHGINHIMYDSSWSVKRLWEAYDTDEIYKEYFKEMFALIKSDMFTQLGHPDTIKMFNYYPTYDLTETYNELADLLNEHHMSVENNVGCYYRYHHKDMGLADELLKIFKDHHCDMTTSSDAHKPEDVGNHIKDVWDITMK